MTPVDAVLFSFSLVCAMTDVVFHKIYNMVTMPVFLSGVAFHVWIMVREAGPGWDGVFSFLAYVAVGIFWLVLWFGVYGLRLVSGGDVKFLMAVYAWIGPADMVFALVCILGVSGIFALAYLIEEGRIKAIIQGLWLSFRARRLLITPDIAFRRPLGLSLFLGVWAYVIWK